MGILFQWFMQWSASKFSPENVFTHKERFMLILMWPLATVGFIFSFIKSFLSK